MQFGVREEIAMLVDKTKEIAELKKQLQEQKNGYEELVKVNDNKEIEKQEAIKKLKNIEEIIRSIQFRQGMASKAIRYTRRDLEKLEIAQKKLERKNKINENKRQKRKTKGVPASRSVSWAQAPEGDGK